jgi:methylenetetrahydrofolate dehydrogenase (NADP+)/methenyltetrahydrofolate cyclohydrolase
MSAKILNGKTLAKTLNARLADRCHAFTERAGRPPGLAVILVGDNPASEVYVTSKARAAGDVGMRSELVRLPADAPRSRVLEEIARLSDDPGLDGLLVQLPLPPHLDEEEIQRAVPPEMDVDGFHPVNAGKLLLGSDDGFVACTPRGVMALIDESGVELRGAEAVVVGRSNIVGKPLVHLLLARHATVAVCHSRTRDLAEVTRRADVLVAAVGRAGLVAGEHVKPGAVVIDVGINEVRDPEQARRLLAGQDKRLERFEKRGRALVGDVHYGEAREVAGAITPVPGGVGPLTVAMLLDNTMLSAERSQAARAG